MRVLARYSATESASTCSTRPAFKALLVFTADLYTWPSLLSSTSSVFLEFLFFFFCFGSGEASAKFKSDSEPCSTCWISTSCSAWSSGSGSYSSDNSESSRSSSESEIYYNSFSRSSASLAASLSLRALTAFNCILIFFAFGVTNLLVFLITLSSSWGRLS